MFNVLKNIKYTVDIFIIIFNDKEIKMLSKMLRKMFILKVTQFFSV